MVERFTAIGLRAISEAEDRIDALRRRTERPWLTAGALLVAPLFFYQALMRMLIWLVRR